MDKQQTATDAPKEAVPKVAAPVAAPKEDLSSKTVFVLAILVVVVSLIGAWINIHAATSIGSTTPTTVHGETSSAQVGFAIESPKQPLTQSTTGHVVLDIEK
jgi:hypothetical protein